MEFVSGLPAGGPGAIQEETKSQVPETIFQENRGIKRSGTT